MTPNPSRRLFLQSAGALAAMTVVEPLLRAATPATAKRKNLVFVFPDQMRASAMSFSLGADPVLTPRLDAFATQSTMTTECCSNYPLCSPYRAALLTGMYAHKNGVVGNILSKFDYELRDEDVCFTDVLHREGYAVGYVGKWHLTRPHEPFLPKEVAPSYGGGVWNEFTPSQRRHSIDYWCGYNTYDSHLTPVYWKNDATRDQWMRPNKWEPTFDADQAIAFLENQSDALRDTSKPFALFVSMNPPHPPYHLYPEPLRAAYSGKSASDLLQRSNVRRNPDGSIAHEEADKNALNYFAMVSGVDHEFGRILDAIDRGGHAEDTLVVFTSDHGEMMGSHGLMQKNCIYEEAFNVPLLFRLPGVMPAGRRTDLAIGTPDLTRTIVGMLGIEQVPPNWQGRDLSRALVDDKLPRPDGMLYMRNPNCLRGWRNSRYTLLRSGRDPMFPEATPSTSVLELYDRHADPYENTNVAADQKQVVNDLTDAMMQDIKRIGDAWTPVV